MNTWQATARSIAGGAATISVPVSPNTADQTRLRALYCTLDGSMAGSGTVVVRDGATGVGTIIFRSTLALAGGGIDVLERTSIDLRTTPGNLLTVEFLAGTASDFQSVNAQGDYVPPGTPYGATLTGE
jgi:hypothetical protein